MWLNRIIVKMVSILPQSVVWIFSKRYIAGKTLEEAVQTAKQLNASGCLVTMDVLGEDIINLDEAREAKTECLQALDAIRENEIQGSVSVKLTQLGLQLDANVCYEHIYDIVAYAKKHDQFVRIDMEDHSCTDATLDIYKRLRKEFDNVGTVIQAYLLRSQKDVAGLMDQNMANLRLCKGIYDEPRDIALKKKQPIRDNFKDLIQMMLNAGEFTAIATHDKQMVRQTLGLLNNMNVPKSMYEFQMLLGVTEKLRQKLVADGHAMRIYVPYGDQWHAYSMRRLKENPALAGHIVKNLFVRA